MVYPTYILVRELQAREPSKTLTLNAGDYFQGTMWYNELHVHFFLLLRQTTFKAQYGTSNYMSIFRCASISSTYPCQSVGESYFRISILSVFLVALREKLKREDPNYFPILGLVRIS